VVEYNRSAHCNAKGACYTPGAAGRRDTAGGSCVREFWDALSREFAARERLATLVVNLFWSLIAIVTISVAARLLRGATRRVMTRARVPHNVVQLARNGVTLLAVVLAVAVLLSIFGVPPTAVVTGLSLATAGIALSFQEVLKNLIAGIYLLVEHPFTVGDRIRVRDTDGVVEAVNVRTTALRTNEGVIVIVPNNVIFTEIVHNRTMSGITHATITLSNVEGVPDEIIVKMEETIAGMGEIAATPEPRAQLLSLKGGVAEVQVEFWFLGNDDTLVLRAISRLRDAFPDAAIAASKAV